MANHQQRDNTGTLFINNRKEKDTHPDRTGTIMIEGVEYYLSGWDKSGPTGERISLSVKKKEQRQEAPKAYQASQKMQQPDYDDSVPF